MTNRRGIARRGFTLVEILIVVIILGILAAIVIPQFTNASQNARESSLQSTLQTLRSQIQLYKLQHGDSLPAADAGGCDAIFQFRFLKFAAERNCKTHAGGRERIAPGGVGKRDGNG